MKQCPKCQSTVKDTAKFCQKCGVNIKQYEEETKAVFCTECGARLEDGDFCTECGARVSNAEATSESTDTFGDDWLSDINEVTSADIAREKARQQAEEAARLEAEERERQRRAAEEAARQEAERRAQEQRQELIKRRNTLFDQKFFRESNTIFFGRYPECYDGVGGYSAKEQIAWRILEEDDESVLVITANIIAYRPFRNEFEAKRAGDYIHSSLRSFLNGDFLSRAFTEEERSFMKPTMIDYHEDKIFILSREEREKYHFRSKNAGYFELPEAWIRPPQFNVNLDRAVLAALWIDKTKLG